MRYIVEQHYNYGDYVNEAEDKIEIHVNKMLLDRNAGWRMHLKKRRW